MTHATASPSHHRRLILILSSERSGSTLTRVILGENSRIVAPQELFLMRYPDYRTWRQQKPVAIESLIEFCTLIGEPHDAAWIDARCAGKSVLDAYRWMIDLLPRNVLLLDKTPAYANDGATLRRSLPLEPYYVWLIRHPLGVIESTVRLKVRERRRRDLRGLARALRDTALDTLLRSAHGLTPLASQREVKWVVQQTVIREFLATVPEERKAVVKFEHLVRNPEAVVRQLCTFLGVPVEEKMLAATAARKVMNVHLGDPNFHTHTTVEAGTADLWRRHFSEDRLTAETLRLMDAIGVVRDS